MFNDAPSCIAQSPDIPVYCPDPPRPFEASVEHVHLRRLLSAVPHQHSLSTAFEDAWLSGARSLRIQGFLYPLWTVSLLRELDLFTNRRGAWRRAVYFLDNVEMQSEDTEDTEDTEVLNLVEECRATFDMIPLAAAVPSIDDGRTLQTWDLAVLLDTGVQGWLSGELIDGGADYIRQRFAPSSKVEIASTLVPGMLRQRTRWDPNGIFTHQSRGALARLESHIRDGTVTTGYFPLHVHGGHWTLLRIDFVARTFEYADSRDHSAILPADIKADFLRWLSESHILPENVSPATFRTIRPSFAIPEQRDADSCGVVVLSTMASILLRSPTWTQESSSAQRMMWFLRLSEVFGEGSSVSYLLRSIVSFRSDRYHGFRIWILMMLHRSHLSIVPDQGDLAPILHQL